MRNLKLTIEYDGTNYCGWQIQAGTQSNKRQTHTIQEVIEKALQRILQEKVRLIGSGRTDAGVHALAQVANFKTRSSVSTRKLQQALNSLLPQDLVIKKIEEVALGFHSRFKARAKVYRYTILNRPYRSALFKDKVYFYPFPLNAALMRREARCLLGRHDFRSFCASGSNAKSTIRTIKEISIKKMGCSSENNFFVIEIEADGFLYNMVRNIVGTLLEIGRGKLPGGSLKKIMCAKDRRSAGPTAPACGLCLLEVKYKK